MRKGPHGRAALDVARRRTVTPFFVVDDALRVIFRSVGASAGDALPDDVVPVAQRLVRELARSRELSAAAVVSTFRLVRVERLQSVTGVGHYAVMLERFAPRYSTAEAAERYGFSPREVQVLEGLMRGDSVSEIAASLNIAPATAQEYVRNIGRKTKVTKRAAIVATVFDLR